MSTDSPAPQPDPEPSNSNQPPRRSRERRPQVKCPPDWARFLYNHNPFYLISTFLVLYGIRLAYGDVAIGELNCWGMMAVLTIYTLMAAGTAVLIVKVGSVWDDARSLMLALCILFVAISVSTDELLMLSPRAAFWLILYGYLLSAGVSQWVISGTGIRLTRGYLIPFHLMLLLLQGYSYVCSPEAWDWTQSQMDWCVFLFPQLFALLLLSLWPAVSRGPEHVASNGTPWRWPLFPGSLFFVLFLIAGFRSYILSLSFGPSHEGNYAVVFDAWFLIPLVLIGLLLLFEGGIASERRRTSPIILACLPLVIPMAHPYATSGDATRFLGQFMNQFGSPLWLTGWAILAFYLWGLRRGIGGAYWGAVATGCFLTMLTPRTWSLLALNPPSSLGLAGLSVLLALPGLRYRRTSQVFASILVMSLALARSLFERGLDNWSLAAGYHTFLIGTLLLSLIGGDAFAILLRRVSALLLFASSVVALLTAAHFPGGSSGVAMYFVTLTVISALSWQISGFRMFRNVMLANLVVVFAGALMIGYRSGVQRIGRGVMFSLSWSIASFGTGLLISLGKAGQLGWLKRRMLQLRQRFQG